jgi:flagellar biogenesis protein FliO
MQFTKKTSSSSGVTKKTSSSSIVLVLAIKLGLVLVVILGVIFLLNKIDFPAPKKEIEKIIPNENFKIVK